jgi:hypothetical protein
MQCKTSAIRDPILPRIHRLKALGELPVVRAARTRAPGVKFL